MTLPLAQPSEAVQGLDRLGEFREEFRPHPGNLIAAGLIGPFAILAGAGIVLYILRLGNLAETQFQIVLGCGALFMFSGTATLIWCWCCSAYRVRLYANGLAELSRWGILAQRWQDIEKVDQVEKTADEAHFTSDRLTWTIVFRSGEQMKFNVQSVRDVERLMACIKRELEQRNIPWNATTKWL